MSTRVVASHASRRLARRRHAKDDERDAHGRRGDDARDERERGGADYQSSHLNLSPGGVEWERAVVVARGDGAGERAVDATAERVFRAVRARDDGVGADDARGTVDDVRARSEYVVFVG